VLPKLGRRNWAPEPNFLLILLKVLRNLIEWVVLCAIGGAPWPTSDVNFDVIGLESSFCMYAMACQDPG
jgi:hypothetical protein